MTSSVRPSGGTDWRYTETRGYGLVIFASILLMVIAFFNFIYGITAIAQSHVFVANAHYVFGDLRTWGWITLIISIVQLADLARLRESGALSAAEFDAAKARLLAP